MVQLGHSPWTPSTADTVTHAATSLNHCKDTFGVMNVSAPIQDLSMARRTSSMARRSRRWKRAFYCGLRTATGAPGLECQFLQDPTSILPCLANDCAGISIDHISPEPAIVDGELDAQPVAPTLQTSDLANPAMEAICTSVQTCPIQLHTDNNDHTHLSHDASAVSGMDLTDTSRPLLSQSSRRQTLPSRGSSKHRDLDAAALDHDLEERLHLFRARQLQKQKAKFEELEEFYSTPFANAETSAAYEPVGAYRFTDYCPPSLSFFTVDDILQEKAVSTGYALLLSYPDMEQLRSCSMA